MKKREFGPVIEAQRAKRAALAAEALAACRAALAADGLVERPKRQRREGPMDPLRELLATAKAEGRPCWREAQRHWVTCERLWGEIASGLDGAIRAEARKRTVHWTILELEDLMQIGFLGLLRAAEDWRPAEGSFYTYGRFWIVHAMNRALLQEGEDVVIPTSHQEDRLRLAAELDDQVRHGRPRNLAEAAARVGIPLGHAEELVGTLGYPERLDAPLHGLEDAPTLGDTVSGDVEPAETRIDRARAEDRSRAFGLSRTVIRTLPQREAQMLLNELIAEFGLHRERPRPPPRSRADERQMALPLLVNGGVVATSTRGK